MGFLSDYSITDTAEGTVDKIRDAVLGVSSAAKKEGIVFSEDQEDAFQTINNMKPGDMVFLTGKAGSGKSTLVEEFCKVYSGVIKLASTGIAAQNIGGRTIHAFMGLRPGIWQVNPKSFKERLGSNNCVMIDEISMVNTELFDFVIERFKYYSQGTMKFLFVGDFNQLPPVEGDFCHCSKFWPGVQIKELTHIHRQKDMDFIGALNDIRDNKMRTPAVMDLINERTVLEHEEFPDDAVVVSPRRRIAEDYNNERLQELSNIQVYEAGILKGTWKDNKIPRVLQYAEGARVLMLTNDPERQWVNGSTGIIRGIDGKYVDILLDDGGLINVRPQKHELLDGNGRPVLVFKQYPFQLGYAITIHKSQGLTLDKIAVDMADHFGGTAMTYVAMSRCRTKEGLYLLGNYYG